MTVFIAPDNHDGSVTIGGLSPARQFTIVAELVAHDYAQGIRTQAADYQILAVRLNPSGYSDVLLRFTDPRGSSTAPRGAHTFFGWYAHDADPADIRWMSTEALNSSLRGFFNVLATFESEE